ncbi:response regulator [Priestia megaterium]|uniref:response regulator n=1 Tax=Priestia megaterium TaxID=1404 RepID=UPI00101B9A1D|nr:response regulator [Priestia megaterium]
MTENQINVMIIEDDSTAAQIYEQFTKKLEHFAVVATAGSGEQALELLTIFTPQLILLDVFLPDINGVELLWEIRKKYRGIDIILITAANDVETVGEAIRGGAFGYLVKPVIIDKFLSTLKHYQSTRIELTENKMINQDKIDHLFRTYHNRPTQSAAAVTEFPKGIDKHTLRLVRDKVREVQQSLNVDEFAQLVGISYSTMRRYLEYLVSCKEMQVEIVYGSVGRPERKYRVTNLA